MDKGIQGSINLRRNGEEETVDLSGKVHLLPCCIKYNGPCDVSDYFKPKPTGNMPSISDIQSLLALIWTNWVMGFSWGLWRNGVWGFKDAGGLFQRKEVARSIGSHPRWVFWYVIIVSISKFSVLFAVFELVLV